MQTITVMKTSLLEKLKENRTEHRDIFLDAQAKYRERIIDELDKRLADVRAGRKINVYIALPEPQDYTEAFDTAIAMVEWAQGNTIDLSEKDFNRYVLNKWEWQQAFAANTQSYLAES